METGGRSSVRGPTNRYNRNNEGHSEREHIGMGPSVIECIREVNNLA